jgi:hypothetical protein
MNLSPSYDDITWVIPPTVTEDLLEKCPIEVAVRAGNEPSLARLGSARLGSVI